MWNRVISLLLASGIFLCILNCFYVIVKTPKPAPIFLGHTFSGLPLIPVSSFQLQEDAWSKTIRTQIKNVFRSYSEKCSDSDFLRPYTGKCTNTSGFSLTAVEGLEALYISGLTEEFTSAKDTVLSSVKCDANDYINVQELSASVIGSLIGTYSITNDAAFLRKAYECGEVLLSAFDGPIPHPIMNGKRRKGIDYSIFTGTTLSESSSFLAEFLALTRLTNDTRFAERVDAYLECVLHQAHSGNIRQMMNSTWSTSSCTVSHNGIGTDESGALFISNILRAHIIRPSSRTERIIHSLSAAYKTGISSDMHFFDAGFCPIVGLVDRLSSDHLTRLRDDVNEYCRKMNHMMLPSIRSRITKIHNRIQIDISESGFQFDATSLIQSITEGHRLHDVSFMNKLNDTTCGDSMCALIQQNPARKDNFQPSSVLGQWLKFLFLGNATIPWNTTIINEAGHFIPTIDLDENFNK